MREEVRNSEATPARTVASGLGVAPLKTLPPLTERQAECLTFILSYFNQHKLYPTQREVAVAMNIQSSTAEMYLEPLRKKGYLHRKVRRQRRNIRLTPKAREAFESIS